MRKEQFVCPYEVYDAVEELSQQDAELMHRAHEAARNAYAPYSKFNVGAAVRLANGKVVTGNNIENAAYPSGLCAERVAMFAAMAQYPGVAFESLAVTAYSANKTIDEPVAPCGACREFMVQLMPEKYRDIEIMADYETGRIVKSSALSDLTNP